MGFFQLRSLPGSSWPRLPAPEVSQLWAAYQQLDRTQWLSHSEIEELQFQQLRTLLAHCASHVPYYRRVFAEAGVNGSNIPSIESFRQVPILARESYQNNFADMQAESLPAGVTATGIDHTSGTNGVPLTVLKTTRTNLWWYAFFLRDLEWSGIDPRKRIASIRYLPLSKAELARASGSLLAPCWNETCHRLMETGHAYAFDIHEDPRRQIQWLKQVNPDYLLSMPSNLAFLASLLRERGERISNLQAIQAIGESLSETTRALIEESFGVPVKNLYSSTEAGYMASPCPLGHGMHVHGENVIAEVVDSRDEPCKPGETGQLVITVLHNFRAPFIRYAILDEVTLAPGPCPCGRGLPLWTRIEGRRYPLLFLPDGRRKVITGMMVRLREVGDLHQFQIVQRALEHVIVRIVPARNWTPDHVARARQVVIDEFESPIRVDVDVKDRLELPLSGKLKVAIVEMEDASAEP